MRIAFIFFILFASICVSAESQVESSAADACSIELFSKVYRLEVNQTLSGKDIVYKTNCDSSIFAKLSQIISNSSGSLGADFLKRELKKDFPDMEIEISPRKLSLLDFNLALKDQLAEGSNLFFLNSKSLNAIRALGLQEGEQMKANCESCNSLGEKNIKLDIINPLTNTTRTLWFSSKVMAQVKVFKAKRSLSFQQKHLEPQDFYADQILTSSPDNLLSSLENIEFYKANRTILQDSVVTNLDLQAVNLVTYGTPVQVTLKNQNINLQKTAMPTRSALFGEVVELRNTNNNKILAGKVVNYNEVVIEL